MSKLRLVAIVALIALLIRLVVLTQLFSEWPVLLQTAPGNDDHSYHTLAQQLASGEWFTAATGPWLYAPLYPHILGALYALTGTSGVLTGVILNAVAGIGAAVVVALLGLRLFGSRAGFIGGVLMALSGTQIFYESLLLNDAISTVLMMGALWYTVDFYERWAQLEWAPDRAEMKGGEARAVTGQVAVDEARRAHPLLSRAIPAGALFGLSALARPSNLLVAGVLGLALIIVCVRTRSWRILSSIAVAALLILVVMAPFVIRNGLIYGRWMTNTGGPVTVYMGNSPGASGHLEYSAGYQRVSAGLKDDGDWLVALGDEVKADPLALPAVLGRKTLLFFNAWDIPDNLDYHFFHKYLSSLHYLTLPPLALWVAGVTGLILTLRERRRLWPLYLFGASFALSIIVVLVAGRYKLPFMALLALFGGAALSRLTLSTIKNGWRRAPVVALALLFLTIAFWPRPSADYDYRGFPLRDNEFVRLAPALYELGQKERAIGLLREGEALLPAKLPNLAGPLAEMYLREGRPVDALAQSQPVLLEHAAEMPLALRASLTESQARALFRLGRNEEGCAWARELKKIRPDALVPAALCE